ncbi:Ig-like domain-containing protein [Mycobacterium sp. shizuoka-1]|uniref:Ig-like domain-containing protein n=1 Tax=Mycobacterium sp. shizuoka-1 TaxID=2039281 RepID=UPI000C065701|nr:Ig-like domain-containing protein [Mycobacterium sp. shizuoka-1]GAY15398.1 hypothetical protein MSZK_21240 [Mycobacterium sp. shizuoka-1]
MHAIWVPRLAAAAFTLGVGAAVLSGASEAAAAPDSGTNSTAGSPSHASSARPSKAVSGTAKTAPTSSRAKSNTKVHATATSSRAAAASAQKSTDSGDQAATPASAVLQQPKSSMVPNQLSMFLKHPADVTTAAAAVLLGYAPDDLYDSRGLPPLRTIIEHAVTAVRRQLNGDAPNVAPTARPVQVHEFSNGEVIGDLMPSDANGDKLTYSVVGEPADGTFVINKNGTYYYKPSVEFANTGGVDVVQVAIDDGATSTVVNVPITVAAGVTIYKGFDINNVTSERVTLTGYTSTGDLYKPPTTPSTYGSIDSVHINVAQYIFSSVVVGVGFTGEAGELWTVYLRTPPAAILDDNASTWCASAGGSCSAPAKNQWIDLMDGGDVHVIRVGPDDPVRQAELLYKLCPDGGRFSCNFVTGLKPEETVFLNKHLVGLVNNNGSGNLAWESSKTETVSETTSIGGGAELSGTLAKLINLKITSAYRHDWTSSIQVTSKWSYQVQPYTRLEVYASDPYYRVWGNFTIRAGNTIYEIQDVNFDTPVSGLAAELDTKTTPIPHASAPDSAAV